MIAPLVPILAGIALIAGDRASRVPGRHTTYAIALCAAVIGALATGYAVFARPVLNVQWVPAIGMRLHLSVDGISAPLLVLTAVLGFLVVLHGRHEQPGGGTPGTYFGCLLLVTGGALATFLAQDAISFFLAFELVLVPMWVLIHRFGDPHQPAERARAAAMFILYTVLGSTLMLVGILALVFASGTSDLVALGHGTHLSQGTQTAIAAVLLIGLAIKVPMWPLHSWLPRAHTVAPTAGSVLLAAVLLKMGTYGIVRLVVAPLPLGMARLAPVVGTLAVVGILWGGLVCLVERSLKRLIAWSSVAHMGFVMLGIASGTALGLQAALFGNIAHGVISALLFTVVGGLKQRWGGDDLHVVRDALRDVSPRLGFALVVGFAASLGLPGLAGFWGEVLAMFSAWGAADDQPGGWFKGLAAAAAVGTVLAAGYSLRVLRLVWVGGADKANHVHPAHAGEPLPAANSPATTVQRFADAHGPEWIVVGILVAAVVAIGVDPVPVLHTTDAAVARIFAGVTR
ncbi:complex I subunit 4 family protein [Leekyejoonella antrihumi]|uniref:complex I subunit 4 family protein n=1 Tax=Leekyejoonella antrihumi TaxID=1660198 RepID=UPI0016485E2C|nr:NADH-quinone oxidoreductase subunit M [Leekyejoonella antrihumi]